MTHIEPQQKKPKYIPVSKWEDYHDWPTIPSLRWMIHNKERNGIGPCIKKVGGRVLVNEEAFFKWVESQSIV